VFPIEIPPLREREEDIPHIVQVILERLTKFHSKEIHHVHQDVIKAFRNYAWPGNIRELENLLERAYIIEESSVLTPESFPSDLFGYKLSESLPDVNTAFTLAEVRRKGMEQLERCYLREILSLNKGRIKDSAEAAHISSRQLHNLMKKYGLTKEQFKAPSA
jgi:DNA-binding NtrC family response regulator